MASLNIVHLFSPGVELKALQSVSPASTPRLKGPLRASQCHLQTVLLVCLPRPRPTLSSLLIAPLWVWGRRKPCVCKLLPAACLPRLFLAGSGAPGSLSPNGNYSSGQLSLAFLASESCIFLPIFGADLVAGQPSRASLQGEAQPSAHRSELLFPSSPFDRAPGRRAGMDAELPGKGVEALFFLSVPKRRILSQMFL